MLPQKLGFAIFVAQKLWNWRPFSQKIPLRGQYIIIYLAILMLTGLNQLKFAPPPFQEARHGPEYSNSYLF